MASYYGDGDELQLAFNFACCLRAVRGRACARIVEQTEAAHPGGRLAGLDAVQPRRRPLPDRWANGDPAKIRCALMVLLLLRGTPVLYYGDEIGLLEHQEIPEDEASWTSPATATARAHADAVVGRARPRLHRRRRRALAALRFRDPTWRRSATIPIRC